MNITRTPMPNVSAISTATMTIERTSSQQFYRTPKSWELWQETPELRFIKRWAGCTVLWIHETVERATGVELTS